jgi:hypothetical protein
MLTVKGEPLSPGQGVHFDISDPATYIGRALEAFKIPISLQRDPKQEDGLITINFEGGFPR